MKLIYLHNHFKIRYYTTFCFVLAICMFSIVTVSCRPSVDKIPTSPRSKLEEIQTNQQQLKQLQKQQEKTQININYNNNAPSDSATSGSNNNITTGSSSNEEKNLYGDLHPDKIRQIRKCNENMELMELCMRCAKVTKSPIVYPMCCDNEDNVKSWCEDYVYFGISY